MSRNPSISMTEHQQAFVERMISSGRYHGVSEVVRAGLRLLEAHEERQVAALGGLQDLVQQAYESGEPEPLESLDDIIAEAERKA
ncbi:type II toxin-antitoxin system ParD family antitoxin [Maricaulis sp.]|uniref:type II toxin-antitoxin system ParD family antitoxin n=1 Tax=unclassified Maricaulis TaxID=2632371 RepID=UPI001B28FD75|nr:type II toxin-antitoxin system ParD family antitoxin [Maricaulis sp.]MBO6797106.1 type II toxin-antitoxin system ParD family antitoxin [Maricaulis sp.]